jgi:acetolactate synthase-1/2/3 large subunit
MDDDAVYVADVGQNQLWSADNYVMKNGRFLTTGGMGTMGYSIPAAIGAKMADPGRQVVAVCGDGAFQMSMFELATIAVNRLPVKILVLRNEYLGLVREHQEKVYSGHYSGVQLYAFPHYDKLAEAYDMAYFHADSNEALGEELDRFLACGKAAIMVCDVDSANNTK